MTPEIIDRVFQFGVPTILLLLVSWGGWKVTWWYLENILRPSSVAQMEKQKSESQVIVALGLTTADMAGKVTQLMVASEGTEMEFRTGRRAIRTGAEIVDTIARAIVSLSSTIPDTAVRREVSIHAQILHNQASELRRAMDDGSREFKALTDEDDEERREVSKVNDNHR